MQHYREVLERLFILDGVPGWKPSRNHIAELALPPKQHLADPALAGRLLGATANELLQGRSPDPSIRGDGTLLGALFESLVTVVGARLRAGVRSRRRAPAHPPRRPRDRPRGRTRRRARRRHRDQTEHIAGRRIGSAPRLAVQADRHELLDAIVVTTGGEADRRHRGRPGCAPGTLNRGRARRSALPGRSQLSRRGKRRRPASRRCGDNGDASPLREIVGRF